MKRGGRERYVHTYRMNEIKAVLGLRERTRVKTVY